MSEKNLKASRLLVTVQDTVCKLFITGLLIERVWW